MFSGLLMSMPRSASSIAPASRPMPARVLGHRAAQRRTEPGDVGEQPLVRDLAQRQVEGDLAGLEPEARRRTPATFAGSRVGIPSEVRGRPTSPAPSTSPASAARPCPACIANMLEPICLAMPSSGPSIEREVHRHVARAAAPAAPRAARRRGPRCWASSSVIEDCTCSAIGSMISCQAGIVASSHSERLHARAPAPVEGKVVTASSQRSASRTASSTPRRSASATTGSPVPASVRLATSVAAAQLTAPVVGARGATCPASSRRAGRGRRRCRSSTCPLRRGHPREAEGSQRVRRRRTSRRPNRPPQAVRHSDAGSADGSPAPPRPGWPRRRVPTAGSRRGRRSWSSLPLTWAGRSGASPVRQD